MMDAELLPRRLGSAKELPERMVLIPGDERELLRSGIEIEVVVLSRAQQAIEIRKKHDDGEISRCFLEVEKLADPSGKLPVRRSAHQACEIDDPLLLRLAERSLGIVGLVVPLPVRTEVGKQLTRHRLEDGACRVETSR